MLNKNDPLISAVQKIMQSNQAEREAVKVVNEKFGVTDRKALPFNRQSEWDAAYKAVLTEGVESKVKTPVKKDVKKTSSDYVPGTSYYGYAMLKAGKKAAQKKKMEEEALDEKVQMSRDDIAALKHPKKKITGDDLAALRAGEHKMEEQQAPKTDPYAQQQAGSVESIPTKEKSVTPSDQSALKKKIQGIMKEAKTNPYAIGMAAVKKSTGDEPPMEKKNITKAHKIAKKIIAKKMNEGFNNRHGLSVTASAEKQAVVDLNEQEVYPDYDPAKETQKKFAKLSGANSGKRVKDFISTRKKIQSLPKAKWDVKPEKGNYTFNKLKDKAETFARAATGDIGDVVGLTDPKRGEGLRTFNPQAAQAGDLASIATTLMPGRGTLSAAGKVSRVERGTSIIPKIERGTGQGNRLAAPRRAENGPWGSARPPDVKPAPVRGAPSGTMLARLQQSRQAAQTARAGGSTVAATQTANRARMAQTASGARAGGSTVAANQAATRAQKLAQTARDVRSGVSRSVTGTANLVRTYPKLAAGAVGGAAMTGFAAKQVGNQPPSAQASTLPKSSMSGGAGDYRTAQAKPIKVTDTEVMNSPEFKKARQSVGGESGARNIQVGQRVQGLGNFNKGDTIMDRTRTQLAAKKNIGRES